MRKLIRTLIPRKWHFSEQARIDILRRSDGRVISGPFTGMKYVTSSHGSVFLPKVLGTYEKELAPALQTLLAKEFDIVVVAGAAEGYYAVGFATLLPGANIIAFEPNREAQLLLIRMSELNEVRNRIQLHDICDVGSLRAALHEASHPLVFMDIEGGESILLDPFVVPELATADVVVEVHEFAVQGVGTRLRERFANTHEIGCILARRRVAEDFPIASRTTLGRLKSGANIQAMSEKRPEGMSWLVLTPKKPM